MISTASSPNANRNNGGISLSKSILIINGPNLNMLGRREPEIYGATTLAEIEQLCRDKAAALGLTVECRQSNHEGDIVGWIQDAIDAHDGLIINAAAYTHTSVAIHDALKMLGFPVIEVHISDPKTREPFRHHSYIAPIAEKTISGQGVNGYIEALAYLAGVL